MRVSVIIFLCLMLSAYNAQAQSQRNIKLDITLYENGKKINPIVKDSQRVFFKQVLVVEDGFYGTIYLGERTKNLPRFKDYLVDNEYISRDFSSGISRIGASLRVIPHIYNGGIELSIMPMLSCTAKTAEYNIELKELGRVMAQAKGKPVALNAKSLEEEFFVMFFATDYGKSIGITIVPSELAYGEAIE